MDNRIRLLPGGTQPTSTVSPFAVIEAEQGVAETRAGNRQSPAGSQARELQVTGTAEVSYPADRASVRLSVGNSKATVNEVTSSVSRRLEYILQAVRWLFKKKLHTFCTIMLASLRTLNCPSV